MNIFRAISNILRFDRTNWKALTLCFLGAGIFWAFNALNKTYDTQLDYPLQFEYPRETFVAVDPLPAHLTINVKGIGWELFRKSLGVRTSPITITLDRPAEIKKIAVASLTPVVAGQLGGLTLNFTVTDTLRLRIEPKATKHVWLRPVVNGVTFRAGTGITGPVHMQPDTAWLEGPRGVLESLHDTLDVVASGTRLSQPYRENIEIEVPHKDVIRRNPPVVEVQFNVGAVTEKQLRLPLTLPKGYAAETDSITVLLILPQGDAGALDSMQLTAAVHLPPDDWKVGTTRSLLPVVGVGPLMLLKQIDSVRVKKVIR